MLDKRKIGGLIALGCALAVGITMNIVACTYYGNYWPLITIFAYLLAPLPNVLFAKCEEDPFDGAKNWKHIGLFLTGFLLIAGLGVPAILTHAGVIKPEAMVFCFAGGVIVYISILIYLKVYHRDEEEEFGAM